MAGVTTEDIAQALEALRGIAKSSERTAKANEDLIRLATEERESSVEPSPPFCPHCGFFNPPIHSAGGQGNGPLVEFVLPAQCDNCNQSFFAVPEGWVCLGSRDEVLNYIESKGGDTSDKRS
jgi:hypothetical protein